MTPRFEIRRSLLSRRWRVRLIAENGECLSVSEGLNSREAAWVNVNAQLDAVPVAEVVEQ